MAFEPAKVAVRVESASSTAVRGQLEDELPADVVAQGLPLPFHLGPGGVLEASYQLTACPRGYKAFGDLSAARGGAWGLAWKIVQVSAATAVRSVPRIIDRADALLLARPRADGGLAQLRRMGEGREFDSLREYRQGDDLRLVDWKASAKRGSLVSREFAPERNQTVLILIDCGRHMVPNEGGRTRLDHAIGAAMRLARACLEHGDSVGLLTFGAQLLTFVAPAKGRGHQRALLDAVVSVQPELEESDYGAAFNVLARVTRRSLICVFTDLGSRESSKVLLARMLALRPRHLPLLISLTDAELERMEKTPPATTEEAFARTAAVRLLTERQAAATVLANGGARVVRAAADGLPTAAINEYLRIKERGLL